MKPTRFKVWFGNGDYDPQGVEVWALNQDQAVILAKAERIKSGLDYTLYSITEFGKV